MADKIVKQIKVEETIYDIGGSLYKLDEGNFEKKSLVLNEGEASGISSIAGGTINKKLVTDIVGETVDDYIDIEPSKANASMTIAYGAGNVANASASNAFGIKNQAGVKGYYIWDIDFSTKTITLSTNQRKSRLPIIGTSRKSPNSSILSGWKKGDFISSLSATIQSVNPSNGTIVVDNIPYTEIDWPTVWLPTDMSIVAIPQVKTQTYLGQTFETYRPETVGEVEFGFSSTAFGFDNITSGTLSAAFGMRNTATGTTSFVTGRENMGGFASLVGGYQNTVTGGTSTATGKGNLVTGYAASAHGQNIAVIGDAAHGEGHATTIFVPNSIDTSNVKNIFNDWNNKEATEKYSVAFGNYSHVEGQNTIATGPRAHAEGWMTAAEGWASHAEGKNTYAVGDNSHAEGQNATSNGTAAHAEGYNTIASGEHSHAEGHTAHATNEDAHAEGKGTLAQGLAAHAEGYNTSAIGEYSHSEGHNTVAYGKEAHAEGESSKKCADALLISNNATSIFNDWSSKGATEKYSIAYGDYSHVEGQNNIALAPRSRAEGWMNIAGSWVTHASGRETRAGYVSGENVSFNYEKAKPDEYLGCFPGALNLSVSIHWNDFISGSSELELYFYDCNKKTISSIVFNNPTKEELDYEFEVEIEGEKYLYSYWNSYFDIQATIPANTAFLNIQSTGNCLVEQIKVTKFEITASAQASVAATTFGNKTLALGQNSIAEGQGTIAASFNQHAQGKYNKKDTNQEYAIIVGNGTSDSKRDNAYTLGWNGNGAYYGNLHAAKDLTVGGKASITGKLYTKSLDVQNGISSSGIISASDYIETADNIYAVGDIIAKSSLAAGEEYDDISLVQTNALAKTNKSRLDAQVGEGANSHVEGYACEAIGAGAHAEGHETKANANQAHSEGLQTKALGKHSHAEGHLTTACGEDAHAEGRNTIAHQVASHAEGHGSIYCPKDENGNPTKTNEPEIDSENFTLTNIKAAWEARGNTEKFNMAFGNYSHTEGQGTIALGSRDHAEGWNTMAYGDATHAEGHGTVSRGSGSARGQHVEGSYNLIDDAMTYIHITGIGTSSKRDNGFTVDRSGNGWFKGNITIGGTLKDGAYTGGKTVATQDYVGSAISGLATQAYVDEAIKGIKIPEIPTFGWNDLPGQIPTNKLPSQVTFDKLFISTEIFLEENAIINCYDIWAHNVQAQGRGSFSDGISVLDGDIYVSAMGGDIYIQQIGAENISLTTAFFLAKKNQERLNTIPTGLTVGSADGAEVFNSSTNKALGVQSHAEGEKTTAIGIYSHSEGWRTTAVGEKSHAEGSSPCPYDSDECGDYDGRLANEYSAIEISDYWMGRALDKKFNMAYGGWSHTECQGNLTAASRSHAEGWGCAARAVGSHAEGVGTVTGFSTNVERRYCGQHVQGVYNDIMDAETYLHVVGNGTSESNRSNAHWLKRNGDAWYAGNIEAKALVCEQNYGYGPDLPDESTAVKGQIFFKIPSEE